MFGDSIEPDAREASAPYGAFGRPRVLLVSAEIYPLAKSGGLADVCAALPRALRSLGADLRLMMPGYPSALASLEYARRPIEIGPVLGCERVRIVRGLAPDSGLPVELVDAPELFARDGSLYQDSDGRDWDDNARRFALFCHVASHRALGRYGGEWLPDVVHCHDWHTGLVPLLLRASGAPRPRSVMTIHNIAFQGNFPLDGAAELGIPAWALGPEVAEFYGRLSFLKAGVVCADRITTVSPTYAGEILTPEFGCGLEGVLRSRADVLAGIMNGIDRELWNPESDPHIAARYSRRDPSGKSVCKADLQARFGLARDPHTTLIASASRVTTQKMADIVLSEMPSILRAHPRAQFALIGRGDNAIERGLVDMAAAFPGRAAVRIGYNEPDAHRLHAGADALLHGSRFEPCGLTQLYAMRYGTVPVVRRVGGLSDSVADASDSALLDGGATGFVFEEATGAALAEGVARCIRVHQHLPHCWRKLRARVMQADFGWHASARRYLDQYRIEAGAEPRLAVSLARSA